MSSYLICHSVKGLLKDCLKSKIRNVKKELRSFANRRPDSSISNTNWPNFFVFILNAYATHKIVLVNY